MHATDLIAQIKIASPCHARWEDMAGDERSRFCAQCQKHVYNFSAMTPAAVDELLNAREGKLCAQFYRRADGTMLTADCPVGLGNHVRRLKFLVGTALTLLFASLAVRVWSGEVTTRAKGPFAQKCEAALGTIKGWFGLNPRPVVMGMVCPSTPPTTVATPTPVAASNPQNSEEL